MQEQRLILLRDGMPVRLRPILAEDKAEMAQAFERLSLRSRYQRFFSHLRELSPSWLAYLTEIDYVDHFAFGAFTIDHSEPALIGDARYVRLADDPQAAEIAVAVIDDYQRCGLGKQLLLALADAAVENGIKRFLGHSLWENRPILELLRKAGAQIVPEDSSALRFVVDLDQALAQPSGNQPATLFNELSETVHCVI